MKTIIYLLVGFLWFLSGCSTADTSEPQIYIEIKPAFYELRKGSWVKNQWIRNPENLLMVHETFKKIGYKNLISEPVLQYVYYLDVSRNGNDLLDSLALSYDQPDFKEKYYREFWQRRKAEHNHQAVYLIIKDINYALKKPNGSAELAAKANPQLINDTLFSLLHIEYRPDSMTKELALQDFETLKRLGFHYSAYALLYERYSYQELKWNRDSLVNTLTRSDQFIYPWFEDDTK